MKQKLEQTESDEPEIRMQINDVSHVCNSVFSMLVHVDFVKIMSEKNRWKMNTETKKHSLGKNNKQYINY